MADAVDLFDGLRLLDLGVAHQGVDVEVDFSSCLALCLVFSLGADANCTRSELAFYLLFLAEAVKGGREDDTVPGQVVVPDVRFVRHYI